MAKYIVGPDLTATPSGYDGYYTDAVVAHNALAANDELDFVGINPFVGTGITKNLVIGSGSSPGVITTSGANFVNITADAAGILTIGDVTINAGAFSSSFMRFTRSTTISMIDTIININGVITGSILYSSGSARIYSFDMSGAVVTVSAAADVSIDNWFWPGSASTWALDVSDSIFTINSNEGTGGFWRAEEQADPSFTGNVFYNNRSTDAANLAMILLQATSAKGTCTIDSNVAHVKQYAGLVLAIGKDAPATDPLLKNGYTTPSLSDNTVYGPAYFDTAAHDEAMYLHALLVGNNINASVYRNTVYGAGFGIVVKGNGDAASDTWSGYGIQYNLIHNCAYGLHVKGQHSVPVYHNTVVSTIPMKYHPVMVGDTSYAANDTIIKNNLIVLLDGMTKVDRAIMYIKNGTAISDYNAFVISGTCLFGQVGAVTYATFADWVGAGYDVNSVCVVENSGSWDVYLGSAPGTISETLDYCPVSDSGKLVNRSDNPLIGIGTWITGVNEEGQADLWGKYVHRLPNIGADQGAGAPKRPSRILNIGGNGILG